MIVGVGIDQVEVERMAALLERHPRRAPERLFTAGERERCAGRARSAECFAARFAAKEACLKALGIGLSAGVRWREVEVATGTGDNARPRLRLSGTAARRLREAGGHSTHVSFTHHGGYAVAVVIIEG